MKNSPELDQMNDAFSATRASLILRLQDARDVAAWEEFAAIYGPVVYRVAVSRGFQTADAENLVQEVFLAVAGSVTQWLERKNRGRFRYWLLQIARHEAVNMLTQRATRQLGRDGSTAEQILSELPARDDLPGMLDLEYEQTLFQHAAERIRNTVAQHTWDAFWMTSVEGISVTEAAKILETRPGNIYFARSRVMSHMREFMQQFEDQE